MTVFEHEWYATIPDVAMVTSDELTAMSRAGSTQLPFDVVLDTVVAQWPSDVTGVVVIPPSELQPALVDKNYVRSLIMVYTSSMSAQRVDLNTGLRIEQNAAVFEGHSGQYPIVSFTPHPIEKRVQIVHTCVPSQGHNA